jgi:hypothetical protein
MIVERARRAGAHPARCRTDRCWRFLRRLIPSISALFLVAGQWILLADRTVQGIIVIASGTVVGGSYFTFRRTVRYVEGRSR